MIELDIVNENEMTRSWLFCWPPALSAVTEYSMQAVQRINNSAALGHKPS